MTLSDQWEHAADALQYVPPWDREVWWLMAMAVKNGLGEAGFELWNAWSRQDTRPVPHGYNIHDARMVWDGINPQGKTTFATLFWVAKEYGWTGQILTQSLEPRQPTMEERAAEVERERLVQETAKRATRILTQASMDTHPYLASKGFPEARVLVLGERVVVPMRHHRTGKLQSIQTITAEGEKKFLRHGRAGGAIYRVGRKGKVWWVEGLATALSVDAALEWLYRQDSVVVCFSAQNLGQVARGGYVVADHDLYHCANPDCQRTFDYQVNDRQVVDRMGCPSCGGGRVSLPAGARYAVATGLAWWQPAEPSTDANDYMLRHGVEALADALRGVLRNRMV